MSLDTGQIEPPKSCRKPPGPEKLVVILILVIAAVAALALLALGGAPGG
jgi:hypothetical protein